MHMTDYNKLDALKYLASTKLSKVILEDDSKTYTKEELDRFIETASNA
jgi:hypothetical protein